MVDTDNYHLSRVLAESVQHSVGTAAGRTDASEVTQQRFGDTSWFCHQRDGEEADHRSSDRFGKSVGKCAPSGRGKDELVGFRWQACLMAPMGAAPSSGCVLERPQQLELAVDAPLDRGPEAQRGVRPGGEHPAADDVVGVVPVLGGPILSALALALVQPAAVDPPRPTGRGPT